MTHRRQFTAALACTLAAPALLHAQPAGRPAPVEGTHYVRLSQPLPAAGGGQFEVIEFFWYGCPHCNAFEPALEAWVKQLPSDVAFRRVPVAFANDPYVAHQKLYYALEALGLVEAMHRKVFYAIHNERQRLTRPEDMAAFVAKNGGDAQKFIEAYNSFGVQGKLQQAQRLAAGYKIDGVPAMGVNGRWYTAGSLAGTNEAMLGVVDHLLQRLRGKA